eukprot:scaffold7548_cov126-Isochrysis_galbana.AAC.1
MRAARSSRRGAKSSRGPVSPSTPEAAANISRRGQELWAEAGRPPPAEKLQAKGGGDGPLHVAGAGQWPCRKQRARVPAPAGGPGSRGRQAISGAPGVGRRRPSVRGGWLLVQSVGEQQHDGGNHRVQLEPRRREEAIGLGLTRECVRQRHSAICPAVAPRDHQERIGGGVAPRVHQERIGGGVAPRVHQERIGGGVAPRVHQERIGGGVAPGVDHVARCHGGSQRGRLVRRCCGRRVQPVGRQSECARRNEVDLHAAIAAVGCHPELSGADAAVDERRPAGAGPQIRQLLHNQVHLALRIETERLGQRRAGRGLCLCCPSPQLAHNRRVADEDGGEVGDGAPIGLSRGCVRVIERPRLGDARRRLGGRPTPDAVEHYRAALLAEGCELGQPCPSRVVELDDGVSSAVAHRVHQLRVCKAVAHSVNGISRPNLLDSERG